MVTEALWVMFGGATGALFRFLALLFIPAPVVFVNILGSFIIGLISGKVMHLSNPHYVNFLSIGLLGSFTTFSAFSLNTMSFFYSGDTLKALGYIAFSVIGCLLSCYLGLKLANLLQIN